LKQIKKSDTDKCKWCPEIDDTVHFYAECQHLSGFWASFAKWYAGMTNEKLTITLESIIVGFTNKQENIDTLNACMLLAKWHIYKQKLNESEVFFYKFLCELKYFIKIEKIIAIKNNKLDHYINIWFLVENHIT
jgi:hypothetical protein